MPILASELVVFGSEDMTDTPVGGGRRSGAVISTGVQNAVFPDVTADDFLVGRVKVRKLYPSVSDADTPSLLQAATFRVNAPPSDPLVNVCLLKYGSGTTRRSEFDAAGAPIAGAPIAIGAFSVFFPNPPPGYTTFSYYLAASSASVSNGTDSVAVSGQLPGVLPVGSVISIERKPAGNTAALVQVGSMAHPTLDNSSTYPNADSVLPLYDLLFPGARGFFSLHAVTSNNGTTVGFSPPIPDGGAGQSAVLRSVVPSGRAYAPLPVSGALTAGATALTLSSWTAPLIPQGVGYPTTNIGLDPAVRANIGGLAPAVAVGDVATLYHEAETAPGVRVNTDVINVGRTNLAQIALVNSAGVEIGRVLANDGTTGGPGFTVNLAAGTLTCNDVSTWAQPVKVRHRIEERVAVSDLAGVSVTLSAALSRDFGSGSFLTTECPLGDLQPTMGTQFSQKAWTQTWSDAVVGSPVGALYLGSIPLQAAGAETDRWAAVFTSSTQYSLYSERYGLVGAGNVATDYIPLSPVTGQPLLTMRAAGWVPGSISIGNAFRFNTVGPYAPVWVVQSIRPGVGASTGTAALVLRGSVDA